MKTKNSKIKKIFIICIDINIMQDIGDTIDSIWFSERKANKRKKELESIYNKNEEDHIAIIIREISK